MNYKDITIEELKNMENIIDTFFKQSDEFIQKSKENLEEK